MAEAINPNGEGGLSCLVVFGVLLFLLRNKESSLPSPLPEKTKKPGSHRHVCQAGFLTYHLSFGSRNRRFLLLSVH